ncbi:hypothetical protein CPL00134L_CDS0017 [Escherichia phage Phagiculus]
MVKADSYANTFGDGTLGTGSEIFGRFGSVGIGIPAILQSAYVNNALVRRIVDVIPEEGLGAGFHIDGIENEDAFWSRWDELDLSDSITDAWSWARLFGGSAIVAIVRDNRDLTKPVREGAELESVRVYDRQQVRIQTREENPRNSRFGKPVTYRITTGDSDTFYDVHYTRIHIIDGERVPNTLRRQNDGWGATVLSNDLLDAIQDYQQCESYATQLMKRSQQGVWKVKGLAEICDDSEGVAAARLRLAQVDSNGGVANTIGIDAESEDYSVLTASTSGVTDLLSAKFDRIVALSGIHEIVLKAKNVGGVSSSQNTALETFHKLVDRKRKADLLPILEFLIPFIVTEQEWSIDFNPLNQPSNEQKAEVMRSNVESLSALIAAGVMNVNEARDTIRVIAPEVKLTDGDVEQQEAVPQVTEEEVII